MSQKSSVPQAVSFVSQVLKRDTPDAKIYPGPQGGLFCPLHALRLFAQHLVLLMGNRFRQKPMRSHPAEWAHQYLKRK